MVEITEYITSKEIMKLADVKIDRAREILNQINGHLKSKGYIIPNKRKAPRKVVLEMLGKKED